ncbi:hypothetical protein FPS10_19775 [Pseudoruegeria sp. M32A2M]|nr:hypothetical protein [Pseudoruegeria sp. M32A2M]
MQNEAGQSLQRQDRRDFSTAGMVLKSNPEAGQIQESWIMGYVRTAILMAAITALFMGTGYLNP